jgi:O-antigen/teichoic acid export membrane protein
LRGTATLLAAPTFVIVMFMIVLRDELMTFIYGSNYVESSDVFLILIIGQLINILTGQNTVLLSLTGHQKLLMRVALLCVFVSFTVSYMLVRQLGIEGIALGVSLGLFLSNTISLYLVHRKIGITIFASMDLKFLKAAADSVLISKTK